MKSENRRKSAGKLTSLVLGSTIAVGMSGCAALTAGAVVYHADRQAQSRVQAAQILARANDSSNRRGTFQSPSWKETPINSYAAQGFWNSGSAGKGQLELHNEGLQFVSNSGVYFISIPYEDIWKIDSSVDKGFFARDSTNLIVHIEKSPGVASFYFDDPLLGVRLERYLEEITGAR